jgi:hypothetical protein
MSPIANGGSTALGLGGGATVAAVGSGGGALALAGAGGGTTTVIAVPATTVAGGVIVKGTAGILAGVLIYQLPQLLKCPRGQCHCFCVGNAGPTVDPIFYYLGCQASSGCEGLELQLPGRPTLKCGCLFD